MVGADETTELWRPQTNINIFLITGAVANGRAKFEAQNPKPGPDKPIRFFGSRSRTNSPMLPVKTPKVPPLPAAQNGSTPDRDVAPKSGSSNNNRSVTKSPVPDLQQLQQLTSKPPSVVSKFLPKMKK